MGDVMGFDEQTSDDKRYQGRRQYDNELVTHIWRERGIKFMFCSPSNCNRLLSLNMTVAYFFTHLEMYKKCAVIYLYCKQEGVKEFH